MHSDRGDRIDPDVPDEHVGDLLYFGDLTTGTFTAISHTPDGTFPMWEQDDRGRYVRLQRFADVVGFSDTEKSMRLESRSTRATSSGNGLNPAIRAIRSWTKPPSFCCPGGRIESFASA